MKTIEQQLGGLVTRNLGSGNAFGEFDNADGMTEACDDSLASAYTIEGAISKIAELSAIQKQAMADRAELILAQSNAQDKYDAFNALTKKKSTIDGRTKESGKIYWLAEVKRLTTLVENAYTSTQSKADEITKLTLAKNCKVFKAQKAEEKRIADEKAKGNTVAGDQALLSMRPSPTGQLNNPPKDASASDVLKAKDNLSDTSNTKKILIIGGGLILVIGAFLFIRSRRN
jgi:hypothetical protein